MKSTRTLTIVIVISVVINLLLIGFFVGQRLPRWAGPMFGDGPRIAQMRQMDRARGMPIGANDLNIFAAMRSLDPEARKSAQAAFQRRLPEIRANVEAMVAKREAFLAVLADGSADVARLSTALGELREASAAAQEQSHAMFLEIAASLPAETRASFFKAAAQPRGRGPGPRAPGREPGHEPRHDRGRETPRN